MFPCSKIILEIESELVYLESIYSKYVPANVYNEGRWLPMFRYPYTKRDLRGLNINYIEKMISKTPYNPFISAKTLQYDLLHMIYQDKPEDKDFEMNRLLYVLSRGAMGGNDLYKTYEFNLEEYISYQFPNMEVSDYDIIRRMHLDIYLNKVKPYTELHLNCILDIDTNTNLVYLINRGEIGSYRYKEVLDWQRSIR